MYTSMLTKFLIILFGGLLLGFMFYWLATGILSESKKLGDSAAAIVQNQRVSAQQGVSAGRTATPIGNFSFPREDCPFNSNLSSRQAPARGAFAL